MNAIRSGGIAPGYIGRGPLALLAACVLMAPVLNADEPTSLQISPSRWSIAADGGIVWKPSVQESHADHVEMDGFEVAVVAHYEVQGHTASISRQVIWPMLRFHPNETFDHFAVTFGEEAQPQVMVDGASTHWRVSEIRQKGILRLNGEVYARAGTKLAFKRTLFPSTDKPVVLDVTDLTNSSAKPVVVLVEDSGRQVRTSTTRGIYGAYEATSRVIGVGEHTIQPGETMRFAVVMAAGRVGQALPALDLVAEERAREARVAQLLKKLRLETPNEVLNTAFAFAKIRAGESIYRTKGGLLHGPGGGRYYAAIWANDQAEYANPFFGMLGDPIAIESALNSFRHFARFMNAEYRPIPSSIISEGASFWNGVGDRGDMAMIAYGAARFALAHGNRKAAEELWPLIEWSLEYMRRKVTSQGVVASDTDELENRFPSGDANLCTSSLYYDALLSAAMLARELNKPAAQAKDYLERAAAVRVAIERYFGAEVEGFQTYRYYDKADLADHPRPEVAAYASRPDVLRAWIAIPLTVGIDERKAGTIEALFSPRLWTADGLATEAGQTTFWDRATLYALRGVLAVGETARGMQYLTYYSNRRLLGDHVPYPVEAYPEGNQRHLSAESALYGRVFTEGLFGMRPTGLRSFDLTPWLPEGWPAMALRNVHAFGSVFDLEVRRVSPRELAVRVVQPGKAARSYPVKPGASVSVRLGS